MSAVRHDLPPTTSRGPDALIREARQHRRRRYLVVGATALAVLAAAAIVAGQADGSHPRPGARHRQTAPALPGGIPASVGSTVLMWGSPDPGFGPGPDGAPPAYLDNLTARHLSYGELPWIYGCDCRPYLIRVGRRFVYPGGIGIMAIRDDLTGKPRVLAGAKAWFAPSATRGYVWIVRSAIGGRMLAQQVPVNGGPPGASIALPAGTGLLGGTEAGLLLDMRQGSVRALALWNPGAAPRRLPYSASYAGFAVDARQVVYGSGCRVLTTASRAKVVPGIGYDACRVLRVLNVGTGDLLSYTTPPGTAGWVPDYLGFVSAIAISAGDTMIAAYAKLRPVRQGGVRLYVLRRAGPGRRVREVPGSQLAGLGATVAWAARGSWLLYQGAGGHLWAYQATSGAVRTSGTPCCQYNVMVAVPSQSG